MQAEAASQWCVLGSLGTSATIRLGLAYTSSVRQPKFVNPEDM